MNAEVTQLDAVLTPVSHKQASPYLERDSPMNGTFQYEFLNFLVIYFSKIVNVPTASYHA